MTDHQESTARTPGKAERIAMARTLLAPLAGIAGGAAALLWDDADANQRHRHQTQHDHRSSHDHHDGHGHHHNHHHATASDDPNGITPVRHDVHHDAWGGVTEGGTVYHRVPGSHIRQDFDAWS
ncbi:MAG: hypothetical protein ACR2J8_03375 [Thermomicrobiales bacterium]